MASYGYGIMLPTYTGINTIGLFMCTIVSGLIILSIKKWADAKNRKISKFYWSFIIVVLIISSIFVSLIIL